MGDQPAIVSGPKETCVSSPASNSKEKKTLNLRKDAFVGTVSKMDGQMDGWMDA